MKATAKLMVMQTKFKSRKQMAKKGKGSYQRFKKQNLNKGLQKNGDLFNIYSLYPFKYITPNFI